MSSPTGLIHPASTAASLAGAAPASQWLAAVQSSHVMPAAGLVSVADWDNRSSDNQSPGIVGLWQFQMAGFIVDWGTQAWHGDGTEMIFSVGQDPETGDVCQGAWQQTGPRTYALNHIAMGWAAPGADPTKGSEFLRVHIRALVTVDPRGQTFNGKYTVSVYMESASDPFNEDPRANPPIQSGTGTMTGTRVNPDE